MRKILIISPHLDDAVLGAGQLMAGRPNCDVLTLFSGVPIDEMLLTPYDRKSGFIRSHQAMMKRREEDNQALAILQANPIHTDFLDSQYTKGRTEQIENDMNISHFIAKTIEKNDYEFVVAPLGLRHPDHEFASDLVVELMTDYNIPLYLYEDIPARVQYPEIVPRRLKFVNAKELTFIGDGPVADKIRALWCYKSQINTGDLNPYHLFVPERFWKI